MSAEPSDRGGGILLVILLGGLLSAIGLGLAGLTATERALSGNYQAGSQLLYAAEAIGGHVARELRDPTVWSGALAGTSSSSFLEGGSRPVTPWGEVFDVVAATSALQTSTALPSGVSVWRLYASGTLAALSGSAWASGAFLIAWVADDHADQDGDPSVDSNNFVVVRAEARGFGGLKRAVQLVLQYVPPPPDGEAPSPGAAAPGVRVVSWREVR
jgi:hypothetical protein